MPIKGPQGANNLIQWLKWWILEFSHFLLHFASDSTRTHYPGSEPSSLCSFLTLHALQRINKHQFQCLLVWPAQPQESGLKYNPLNVWSNLCSNRSILDFWFYNVYRYHGFVLYILGIFEPYHSRNHWPCDTPRDILWTIIKHVFTVYRRVDSY